MPSDWGTQDASARQKVGECILELKPHQLVALNLCFVVLSVCVMSRCIRRSAQILNSSYTSAARSANRAAQRVHQHYLSHLFTLELHASPALSLRWSA